MTKKGQCEVFGTLHSFLIENAQCFSREVQSSFTDHLQGLKVSCRKYFPKKCKEDNLILNQFSETYF